MNGKNFAKKTRSLEYRIIINSFIPDIFMGILIYIFSVSTTQLEASYAVPAIKYVILIILSFQFLIAPFFDHLVYNETSTKLKSFYNMELDENERMDLLSDISRLPMKCAVLTFSIFSVGAFTLFAVYDIILHLDRALNILSLCECLFGAYIAGAIGLSYCRRVCTPDAYNIVREGIPSKNVLERKIFGTKLSVQFVIYILLPIIFTTIINIYILVIGFTPFNNPELWPKSGIQTRRIAVTAVLNFLCQAILLKAFHDRIHNSNKKVSKTLETMEEENLSSAKLLDTDIRDEISYNHYLANRLLLNFRKILSNSGNIGNKINDHAMELLKVSSETESTAVEQSTGTSEIVSTMEDSNRLSHDIESKVTKVAEVAQQTFAKVQTGSQLLAMNIEKLSQIAQANEETINEIREVNEKINSIWEIVNIINSVADQTKIIAFNAELEATSVTEGGKSFRNVANEIRRLANGTMDSTKEIKERINEIQTTSDSLLQYAQNCTVQIMNGIDLANSLKHSFKSIRTSASENAGSAAEIKLRVSQETEAFEQIVTTLQQISSSIESFSTSTHTIIDSSQQLQKISKELGTISTSTGAEK